MSVKRAPLPSLAGLACLAVGLYAASESSRSPSYARAYVQKNEAVRGMRMAEATILAAKRGRNVPIDTVNDPQLTGLIGPRSTSITTDRGVQASKDLAAHPSFAAAVLEMMLDAGVRRGDLVAVGVTGSLPGLNLAVLSACRAHGADPIVITSVGSSMFGATDPEFTWLDMEEALAAEGGLPYRSVAASLGGGGDAGRGLSPAGRQLIRDAIARAGVRLLDTRDVPAAVEERLAIYDDAARSRGRQITLYVNVGGGVASLGAEHNARRVPPGLSRSLVAESPASRGVIHAFAERGVPVVNLHGVETLARRFGIVDEYGDPARPGEGALFSTVTYDLRIVAFAAVVLLAACFLVLRRDVREQVLGRGHPERVASEPAPSQPRLLSALLVAPLLATAAAAQTWVAREHLGDLQPVAVLVEGRVRNYFRATPQEGLALDLEGPGRLRVVARPEIAPGDDLSPPFRIVVRTGTRGLEEEEWRSPISPDARLVGGGAVGESRQLIVPLPAGPHRVVLSVEGSPVLLRLLTAAPVTGREEQVTITPVNEVRRASLREGDLVVPYFSALPGRPVRYRLTGPANLELLTRVDFELARRGTQSYRLLITDNGRRAHEASFTSTKALTAVWSELPDRVPGKFRRVSLALDGGTHDIEVALLSPADGSVEIHARIAPPETGAAE